MLYKLFEGYIASRKHNNFSILFSNHSKHESIDSDIIIFFFSPIKTYDMFGKYWHLECSELSISILFSICFTKNNVQCYTFCVYF